MCGGYGELLFDEALHLLVSATSCGGYGNILWAAAFVATCAHCAAHGVSAPEAAAQINARRAARGLTVAA